MLPERKTKKITDEELLDQIRKSHLEEEQKKDLGDLVDKMTEEERNELLSIIDESNKVAEEHEGEDEKLAELNKEYMEKLNALSHKESKYVREEFEKFDKKESVGEMKEVEKEMSQAATEGQHTAAQQDRVKEGMRQKHTIRNLFLLVTFLILIAAGVLYGLYYLNQ
ncbi:hypothetical protein KJ742_07405 [Patescibacteria group bacterium]|nr:hypothetical protein [Patescibacteria group bacterium]MBU1683737.1 hypothetical protein [Patescibacteria group bacterium]